MTNLKKLDAEVIPELTRMDLPLKELIDLVSDIAGAKANTTANDPPSAANYEAWRWGTRRARENEVLRDLGWVKCEHDQISGIRHDANRIKLVICNTDSRTCDDDKSPRNVRPKGKNSCVLIAKNGRQIDFGFPRAVKSDDISEYALWYLCVYAGKDFVLAELSRPESEAGGIVDSYSNRLAILHIGKFPSPSKIKDVAQDFAEVDKPVVLRNINRK